MPLGDIRGRESSFYDEVRSLGTRIWRRANETLREWDFGFVHQVLTYTRRPGEALTSFNRVVNSYLAEGVAMLEKYGPIYLERVEYERSLERWMKGYRRFLGRSLLRRRGNPFWDYRVAMLGNLGCSFSRLRLLGALLYDALRTVMSPFTAVGSTLAFGRPPARKP